MLKPALSRTGYLSVSLHRNSKSFKLTVAAAVAQAFIGPRPAGLTINHLDGVKTNNAPENLEYCTLYENNRHATRMGLRPKGDRNGTHTHPERLACGSKNGRGKFNENQVPIIRKMRAEGRSIASLAREFKVAHSTMRYMLCGITWRHVA